MKDYNSQIFELDDEDSEPPAPPTIKPISNLRADIEKRKEQKRLKKLRQQNSHMSNHAPNKKKLSQPHWAELLLLLEKYNNTIKEYSQIVDFYNGKITDMPSDLTEELEGYKIALITDIHHHIKYSTSINEEMISTDQTLGFVNTDDLPTFYNLCTQLSNYQSELVSVVHPIAMKVQLTVQTYIQFNKPLETTNAN